MYDSFDNKIIQVTRPFSRNGDFYLLKCFKENLESSLYKVYLMDGTEFTTTTLKSIKSNLELKVWTLVTVDIKIATCLYG